MLKSWKVTVADWSRGRYSWSTQYVVAVSKASAMRQAKRMVGYNAEDAKTRAGIRECTFLEDLN